MSSSPNCHYHPSQKIAYFCLNQCILPLCDICLAQHRAQDRTGECCKKIIEYRKTQKFALQIVQAEKSMADQNIEKFNQKYLEFKTDVLDMVQKILANLQVKIRQNTCLMGMYLKNLQLKMQKIKENDIKQIILVYLNLYKDPEPSWDFSYQLNEKILSRQLESFTKITKIQKQIIDQLKKRQISTQISADGITPIHDVNESQMMSKENSGQKQKESNTRPLSKSDRKRHRGIFVASSPRGRQEWLSYSAHQKQFKGEGLNLAMSGVAKNSSQLERTQKNEQIKPKLLLEDISESFISKRQPTPKMPVTHGTSFGFPEKVLIFKESSSRKRLERNTPISASRQRKIAKQNESEEKRKEVDSVINRSDIASNSSSSRLLAKKNKVYQEFLNPQEMRELIMKKNGKKGRDMMAGSKILSEKLSLDPALRRSQNR